jgi:hypothetical protein
MCFVSPSLKFNTGTLNPITEVSRYRLIFQWTRKGPGVWVDRVPAILGAGGLCVVLRCSGSVSRGVLTRLFPEED